MKIYPPMDSTASITAQLNPPALVQAKSPSLLPTAASNPSDKSSLSFIATAGLQASPVQPPPPISAKALTATSATKTTSDRSPRLSPKPFTGEAALFDEKRRREQEEQNGTSPNPRVTALAAVSGQMGGMSRLQDAPTSIAPPPPPETLKLSKGMAAVATAINDDPDAVHLERQLQASPIGVSDLNAPGSVTVTASAAPPSSTGSFNASPVISQGESTGSGAGIATAATTVSSAVPTTPSSLAPPAPSSEESYSGRALTYPGPPSSDQQSGDSRAPPRGMSLPMPGYGQESPRSPSAKKHKCPYCATDFTRQHNLKSHLLTHSQEKPYVCQTCQNRFRRLHDLKRHTKLHTGERPHRCLRCGRQFARGDALARHNKGQGGCAGRRTSMGSFAGDDDYDGMQDAVHGSVRGEEAMEGLVYTGESGSRDSDRINHEAEDEHNRGNLPMIKAHDASAPAVPVQPLNTSASTDRSMFQPQHPRTYPPAMSRYPNPPTASPSTLQPPSPSHPLGASSSSSPHNRTSTLSPKSVGQSLSTANPAISGPANSSVFSQGMTESPKPLSPGAANSHQIGHVEGSRHRSPSYSHHVQRLPPTTNPNAPQLPPLGSRDTRHAHSQIHSGHSNASNSGNSASLNSYRSHSGAGSAGGHPAPGSFEGNRPGHRQTDSDATGNFLPSNNDRLWAYVRSLEDRVNSLQGEVEHLRSQVIVPQKSSDPPTSKMTQ